MAPVDWSVNAEFTKTSVCLQAGSTRMRCILMARHLVWFNYSYSWLRDRYVYLSFSRGPLSSAKLPVLKTRMPAS